MIREEIKAEIKELLIDKLDFEQRRLNQIQAIDSGDYNFFFLNIFGKEATIKYKLSHSITTSWGMSLYEQSCKIIAKKVGYECETQKKNLGQINSEVMLYISSLQNDNNRVPNKDEEIEKIRQLSTPGNANEHPNSTVDVWITKPSGEEILIDITTVKNNKKGFRSLNEKNLTWAALKFSQDTNANISPYFAIPYNPEGNTIDDIEYSRFISGNYDRKDILVGNQFWQEISGGKFSIFDMNDIFNEVSSLYSI